MALCLSCSVCVCVLAFLLPQVPLHYRRTSSTHEMMERSSKYNVAQTQPEYSPTVQPTTKDHSPSYEVIPQGHYEPLQPTTKDPSTSYEIIPQGQDSHLPAKLHIHSGPESGEEWREGVLSPDILEGEPVDPYDYVNADLGPDSN